MYLPSVHLCRWRLLRRIKDWRIRTRSWALSISASGGRTAWPVEAEATSWSLTLMLLLTVHFFVVPNFVLYLFSLFFRHSSEFHSCNKYATENSLVREKKGWLLNINSFIHFIQQTKQSEKCCLAAVCFYQRLTFFNLLLKTFVRRPDILLKFAAAKNCIHHRVAGLSVFDQ